MFPLCVSQCNPVFHWSRQASMIVLHPAQDWGYCCVTAGQGETFPLTQVTSHQSQCSCNIDFYTQCCTGAQESALMISRIGPFQHNPNLCKPFVQTSWHSVYPTQNWGYCCTILTFSLHWGLFLTLGKPLHWGLSASAAAVTMGLFRVVQPISLVQTTAVSSCSTLPMLGSGITVESKPCLLLPRPPTCRITLTLPWNTAILMYFHW